MATRRWLGIQAAVKQVTTVTISAYDVNTTYKVTIGGVTISQVGTGGTTSTTATALQGLLSASTQGMFSEITWTVSTNVITGTAGTAGIPFTLSTSVSGGTGTISNSTTTANTSPNDLNDAVNWSGGLLPVNGDDIYFDSTSAVPVYWNLGSLSAVQPNSLNILQSYTGTIGLKETGPTASGQGTYPEYRQTLLQFDAQAGGSTVNIGNGPGTGAGMVKLQLGSSGVWTINQYNSGSPIETGRTAVSIKGPSTATVLNHTGGSLAIAPLGGDTMTIATVNCGPTTAGAVAPTLYLFSGATLTTVVVDNAQQVQINSAVTTLTHKGGSTTITGTGAITTLTVQGGTVTDLGTGTITTLNVGTGGTFNLGDAGAAITITNAIQLYKQATFLDRSFRGSYGTNGFVLNQCRYSDVTIDIGANRTLKPS